MTDVVLRGRTWWLRVGLVGAVVSILVQAPHTGPYESITWRSVVRQGHDFFGTLGPAGTHEAKRTFRVVPAILVRALHLSPDVYFALQVLLGIVTLGVLARFLVAHAYSRRESLVVVAAIAATAIGASWFADTRPLFDAIALSGLVFALASRNPAVVCLSVAVAVWTDERALIAAVPILCFHWARQRTATALGVVAAIALYGTLRWWLTVRYAIEVDRNSVGFAQVLRPSLRYAPLGFAASLEALWIALVIGLAAMAQKRARIALPVIAAASLSGIVAFLVFDVSRSAAYLLPALLVGLVEGLRHVRLRREVLGLCAAVCLLMPTAIVTGYPSMPVLFPLPIQGLLWLSGETGVN